MSDLEHFGWFADPFPEAILLLNQNSIVLAWNSAARRELANCGITCGTTRLVEIAAGCVEKMLTYLQACARSRSFSPGAITLKGIEDETLEFHVEGALYGPPANHWVMIRLTSKAAATSKFIVLNQQIEKLRREVDQRRRLELELIEQREHLRVTLTGIGDAVIATDIDGRITLLNPVAEKQTGWSSAEALGKHLTEVFRIINEETRQPVANPIEKVIREGIIVGLANHTLLIRKDGTEVPIDDSGAPICNASGTIVGAVLVFHDVSERHQLDKQSKARSQELEEEHRRKDEFLAMLGHELRNPLAPIKAALQLQELPNSTEETRVRAQQILKRQVDHLARLVDELLDVARITSGKITLKNERLEVASIVYRAAELCEPLIHERAQQLTLELTANQVYVNGDLQRLTQVLGNIVNNAAKYTQHGGAIHISVIEADGCVEIVVVDNGIGMLPSVMSRIFDAFSQSKRSLARSEGGLGVGLTLARRLVEQHGGTVTAASEGLKKGSEFRIRLPLAPALKITTHVPPNPTPVNGSARALKILVVDDNRDAAEMLSMLLRLRGNEVLTAEDGERAIATAKSEHPAVIFLDIGLPGIDGYIVAKTLRLHDETAGSVIIAVTGYGQQEDRRKTKEAGFDYHLVKPAAIEEIDKILASLPNY